MMAVDIPSRMIEPPSRVEFNKFKFHQLKRLLLVANDETVPQEAVNLIAVSSKFGLVFVGFEGGFKVVKLENILDLDEALRQKNIAATDYPYQKVPSPTPCMIAISADDMTLAVCVSRNSCAVADMYDIRAFADQDEPPIPFANVQLSSTINVELKDFVWNPVVVEMYAFCLSDGSLHIHELVETNLKIVGNLPSVGATAVCWSPKGKQIVVGKKNGSFSQHKPTLEETKKFAPPSISENEIRVISIMWLTTTLFAVVYAPAGNSDDKTPSVVFVSGQKGAAVTYTNYGDVCFGTENGREPRYTMQYIPEWGMLICASSNSPETAVIGFNKNNNVWEPWILDDSGRAELPMINKVDSFPLGMGVIYCAQRKIVIHDTESYSAMPIFFLLATNSLLCPFHMLCSVPGATPLVYPSEPISRDGERKRKDYVKQQQPTEIPKAANVSLTSNALKHSLQHSSSPQANNLFSAPIPTQETKSSSFMPPLPPGQNSTPNQIRSFSKPEINPPVFSHQQTFAPSYYAAGIANENNALPRKMPSAPTQFQNFPSQPATFGVSSAGQTVQPITGVNTSYYTVSSVTQVPSSQVFSFSASSGGVTTTSVITSPHPSQLSPAPINATLSAPLAIPAGQMQSEHGKKNEVNSATNSTYMATLLDEIAEFEKELCNLKEKSAKQIVQIGTKEEMAYLKQNSMLMSDFYKNMKYTMQSLNTEIHTLKNFSLETYAAISEADSREKRIKDRKYLSMLKERSLDPLTIKKNQKIHQLSQYLGTQICEIQDKLDNDWQEFMQQIKNSNRKLLQLPSNEAIIKTVVKNLHIIHNQKEYLESLTEILNKRRTVSFGGGREYHNLKFESFENELGKLADTLLQTKIISSEDDVQRVSSPRKMLSFEKQAALREVLSNRRITSVKPSKIHTPSQSRLCSTLSLISEAREIQTNMMNKENESPDADKKFPEFTSNPMKTVSAFTANVSPAFKGSITQGLPASFPSNRPSTTTVATTQVFTPSSTFTFKAVPSKDIEQPASFSKSLSHSAFKNIAPVFTNKAPLDSSKVSISSAAVSPSNFLFNQNSILQKIPPTLGFTHAPRSPEQSPTQKPSFEPTNSFSLSRKKDGINLENAKPVNIFSPSAATGDAKPVFFRDIPKKFQGVSYSVIEEKSVERIQKSSTPEKIIPTVIAANVTGSAALHSNSFSTVGLSTGSYSTKSEASSHSVVTNTKPEPNSESLPIGKATSPLSPATVQSDGSSVKKLFPTTLFGHPTSIASSLPGPIATTAQPAASIVIKPLFSTNFFGHPNSITTSSSESAVTSTFSLPMKGMQPVTSVFESESSKSMSHIKTENSVTSIKCETAGALSQSNATPTAFKLSVPLAASLNVSQPSVATMSSPGVDVSDSQTIKLPDAVKVEAVDCSVSDRPPTIPHSASEQSSVTAISSPSSVSSTVVSSVSDPPSSVALVSETPTTTTSADSTTVPAASAQPNEIFGKSNSSLVPIFGQPASPGQSSFFGQPSPATPIFAQACAATTATAATTTITSTTTSQSLYGHSAVVTTASIFGQNVTTAASTTTTTSSTGFFGQSPISTTTTTSSFFGQQSSGQPSFFGKASATAPVFGQTSPIQNPVFGQSVSSTPSTPFGQSASGGFFSQAAASGTSVFGQKAQSQTAPPVFGQSSASNFSFAKASSFGQQSTGSFGLAKSVFGQSSSSFSQQPAASSSFGQSPPASGGMFGQNSFFSGLGGKPSEENASKNVFGSVAASPVASNSIFGSQGASGFDSKLGTFGAGSFSSGGGSVAQSGFGAFQQTPQKTGGFGAPAAFGTSPSFGGSPTFGSSPTFGGSLPTPASPLTGSSSFGTPPATGFGNFAVTNAPTFGSLASQTGGFGSAQQQAAPTFGSLQQTPQGGGTFGSPVFGGSPSFGGQQAGFGSPSGKEASAFTQWRH